MSKSKSTKSVETIDINAVAADTQTALALTGAKVCKPKPNRTEILEALVRLQVEENIRLNNEECEARNSVGRVLTEKVKELVVANIEALVARLDVGQGVSLDRSWGDMFLEFELKMKESDLPKPLVAEINKYRELPRGHRMTSETSIRSELKEKMKGMNSRTSRINAMLADTETRKVLTEMLKLAA